jgi:hypothetical protein
VSTKFVQIKALGVGAAYIQVSDLRAIMALLFIILILQKCCTKVLKILTNKRSIESLKMFKM